jgi:UDP-glucose 4-epimerase
MFDVIWLFMILGSSIKRIFVSGGAGFIGSHVVDRLLDEGCEVTAYDNLSNGRREFLAGHEGRTGFRFVEADLLDLDRLTQAVRGHDLVWHLAANTDIIGGHARPDRDVRDCVAATFNMVEAMRQNGIQPILFASSGAVYGDLCRDEPVGEEAGPLLPVGTYAAGKIGSEGFISAYCSMYGLRGWMYRFGNVVGARMTHGVIFDFIRKLRGNPDELEILGDGRQEKVYFLVEECIEGMAYGFRNIPLSDERPCDVFNLGASTCSNVIDIARVVVEEMGLTNTRIRVAGTALAWVGDQPRVHLRVDKMKQWGWAAGRSSDQAIRIAVRRMLGKEKG